MAYVTSWERMGIEKGKRETALALIGNGVSLDIIANSTGIPLEKVKDMAANMSPDGETVQ